MGKKGAKRGRKKNPVNNEKLTELQKFWQEIIIEMDAYETSIESESKNTCMKIEKMYADKLKGLPENIRNMTITEYMEMKKKAASQETIEPDLQSYSQQFERMKMASEKKKTLKKNRIERKRSTSVSVCSGSKIVPQNLLSRSSRVLSESSLNTPLSKRSILPTSVITPKFNPKAPVSKACMRRARAGEVLVSLSGSPVQNAVDYIPEKPGSVALSLGGGKIIKITDDTEIDALGNDFAKKLDEDTKQTLASVKEKIDKMLRAENV